VISHHIYIYIFLQKFITWSIRADYGSYFITTYRQTKSTLKQKKEKEKEKKRRDQKTNKTKQNKTIDDLSIKE